MIKVSRLSVVHPGKQSTPPALSPDRGLGLVRLPAARDWYSCGDNTAGGCSDLDDSLQGSCGFRDFSTFMGVCAAAKKDEESQGSHWYHALDQDA